MTMLKPVWQKVTTPWLLFSFMATALAVPRFYFMLNNQYNWVSAIFLLMWIAPFIFLSKAGRKEIGLVKPVRWLSLLLYTSIGFAFALILYGVGVALFNHTELHWYFVIMNSFNKNNVIAQIKPSALWFMLFTLPTLLLSPVGEEFFFRGMVHQAFAVRWNNSIAISVDITLFGITHVAHYGLVREAGAISISPFAMAWVLAMMLAALTFHLCGLHAKSIWGAVVAHAGFNFGMMWCIVYLVHR